MNINRSLAFLEQVVMAMASRQRAHVPHRSSRLTAVLREATTACAHKPAPSAPTPTAPPSARVVPPQGPGRPSPALVQASLSRPLA